MPTVQRHPELEGWFYHTARSYLAGRPRTGIHVSDLVTPRKAFWRRVLPKDPSDREVLYFMAGRAHEEVFVALARLGHHRKVRGEWLGMPDDPYAEGDGVRYEIDVVVPASGGDEEIPTEFKTNRLATVVPPEQVVERYGNYLEQLGRYAAIRNKKVTYLAVLHLMARGLALKEEAREGEEGSEQKSPEAEDPYGWLRESKPVFPVYQIEWTDEELEAIRRQMADGRRLLEAAVESEDHTILPECPNWMCGNEQRRTSKPSCPVCGGTFDNARLKLCPTCKETGKRSELTKVEEIVFVPSCKWFGNCLPPQWKRHHWGYYRGPAEDEAAPPPEGET